MLGIMLYPPIKYLSFTVRLYDIKFGFVRMYMMPYRIFGTIFTSDLVIIYTDKLLVY